MRVNRLIKYSILLALSIAGVLTVSATQTKSSFEGGDFSGWNAQGKGWAVYGRASSDGSKSAMCSISKGDPVGIKACAKSVSKAQPGFIVKVDLDIAGKSKAKYSKAKVSVICVDNTGQILQEVEKVISTPTGKFHKISIPELMVPSGTVETYLMLMVEVNQASRSSEWWRFDNVTIDVK